MAGYVKGPISNKLSLGTLAGNTLVGANFAETMTESGRIASVDLTWGLSDFTPAADVGPFVVGVAHSDYDDAEIEEAIEISTGWDRGDKIAREKASRLVRQVGIFRSPAGGASGVQNMVLNDGRNIKTRLNWGLTTGDTLKFWLFNSGSAAIGTTVPDLNVLGHANLFIKL